MNKLEMAREIMAVLYAVPVDMISDDHKDIRGYMRLSKADLELKHKNRNNFGRLTTGKAGNKL